MSVEQRDTGGTELWDKQRDTLAHRCSGKGCLTIIPSSRPLCQFCRRTLEPARKAA